MRRRAALALCAMLAGVAVVVACTSYGEQADDATGDDAGGSDGADVGYIGNGDANADAGGDGARFCDGLTGAPWFCADFDEDEDATAGFLYAPTEPGFVMRRDLSTFHSPPASIALGMPPTHVAEAYGQFLSKQIPIADVTKLSIDFEIQVEALDDDYVRFAQVTLRSAEGERFLMLWVKDGAGQLREGVAADGGYTPQPDITLMAIPRPGGFVHVSMTLGGTAPAFDLRVNGVSALPSHPIPGLGANAVGFALTTTASTTKNPAALFHFDNVVIRRE